MKLISPMFAKERVDIFVHYPWRDRLPMWAPVLVIGLWLPFVRTFPLRLNRMLQRT